jgi:uncharacterized membrane protein YvbJ
MALINCPECGRDVSDRADKCPKCAYPISGDQTPNKVQTIEQTSKKLKKQTLFSILTIILGIIVMIVSIAFKSDTIKYFGLLLAFVGIIWLIVAEIKVWWHHK